VLFRLYCPLRGGWTVSYHVFYIVFFSNEDGGAVFERYLR
jgi:hypothetical protein